MTLRRNDEGSNKGRAASKDAARLLFGDIAVGNEQPLFCLRRLPTVFMLATGYIARLKASGASITSENPRRFQRDKNGGKRRSASI